MSTEMQTKVQASPAQNFTPAQTGLLQRQSALCNTPGLVEDSGLDKEKLTLQRSLVDQAGTTTMPRLGHDFSRLSVHSTGPGMIQTKLKINEPGDIYEQEADRVAEQVMRMEEPRVQRQTEEEEEEEFLQTKELPGQSPEVTPDLSSCIQRLRGGGQTLPESVRSFFEPRFGYDFSQVKVHADARAVKAAREMNARAFTVGSDVVFGEGEYVPESEQGKRLLGHELTHIVQQRKFIMPYNTKSSAQLNVHDEEIDLTSQYREKINEDRSKKEATIIRQDKISVMHLSPHWESMLHRQPIVTKLSPTDEKHALENGRKDGARIRKEGLPAEGSEFRENINMMLRFYEGVAYEVYSDEIKKAYSIFRGQPIVTKLSPTDEKRALENGRKDGARIRKEGLPAEGSEFRENINIMLQFYEGFAYEVYSDEIKKAYSVASSKAKLPADGQRWDGDKNEFRDRYIDYNIVEINANLIPDTNLANVGPERIEALEVHYKGGTILLFNHKIIPIFLNQPVPKNFHISKVPGVDEPTVSAESIKSGPFIDVSGKVKNLDPRPVKLKAPSPEKNPDIDWFEWHGGFIYPIVDRKIAYHYDFIPNIVSARSWAFIITRELKKLQTLRETAGIFSNIIAINAAALTTSQQILVLTRERTPPRKISRLTTASDPPEVKHEVMRNIARELINSVPAGEKHGLPRKLEAVAVGLAETEINGKPFEFLVYSVAKNRTYPTLRATADRLGIERVTYKPRTRGRGEVGSPGDAEQILIEGAEASGWKLKAITPSREFCFDCPHALAAEGIEIVRPN